MDGDNKLFVFDRKEVILIFVFVVVIAATAFTLGVRTGKSISLKKSGYTESDIDQVTLKSDKEEDVDEILEGENTKISPEQLEEMALKKVDSNLDAAKQVVTQPVEVTSEDIADSTPQPVKNPETVKTTNETMSVTKAGSKDQYSGKYTIQVGSFDNLADAKEFAETFLLRGYDVIIRQKELGARGTYFRVSLGVFDTFAEADKFINKEQSLFSDQDKIIKKFE